MARPTPIPILMRAWILLTLAALIVSAAAQGQDPDAAPPAAAPPAGAKAGVEGYYKRREDDDERDGYDSYDSYKRDDYPGKGGFGDVIDSFSYRGPPGPPGPTGPTGVAVFAAQQGYVPTAEETTSKTYVDLTTPGPSVTLAALPVGGKVLVSVTAYIRKIKDSGFPSDGSCLMSFSGPGIVPDESRALRILTTNTVTTQGIMATAEFLVSPTAAGTFTAKYESGDGARCSFAFRYIRVVSA